MLSAARLELTSLVNLIPRGRYMKGNRSSSRRARRTVAKDSARSSELVCANSESSNMPIYESEKQQGTVLDCHSSDKLEHLPIKKRRFLFKSSSPTPKIPSPVTDENSNISKSQDDPVQSPVTCPVSCKSELATVPVDKADHGSNYLKKVNKKLESNEDFSGISILAAAACSSTLGREFGYAEDGSGVEEPSAHEGPLEVSTNSEAQSLSKGLVQEEFVNTSDISVGGASSRVTTVLPGEFATISTADCTFEKLDTLGKNIKEPSHEGGTPTVSSDISSMRDEDVVGSPKLHSRDDRLHWDLNVVMDAWEEPFDDQNAHSSNHISQGSGIVVRCVANRKSDDHDLLNEPESSMCDDEKKLPQHESRKLLDQISQRDTRNQVGDDCTCNYQIVSMCDMSLSSECKTVPSSLGDGDFSSKPFLSSYENEMRSVVKPFDIKKDPDNEPSGESMNFDRAPLFTDQRNLSVPSVSGRNCTAVLVGAALTKSPSVSVVDAQVRLTVPRTLDGENELNLKPKRLGKPFDDRRRCLNDDDLQRSDCLQEFTVTSGSKSNSETFSMNVSELAGDDFRVSISKAKMASAEHLEEKIISDAPADPRSMHGTEVAGKLQEDYDSQYEDGELREPTEHVWGEYGAVNEKTECIGCVFDNSGYSVTAADHHGSESTQTRRIKHRDAGNVDMISSAMRVANELCPEVDRPIVDDNDHGKDDNLLKLVHSGDEKMKGHASSDILESNKLSSATGVRGRDDCDVKGRICHLATRPLDSEGADTRAGSRLYRRGLLSQIEPVPFREDQAGNRSKLGVDGVAARWDQGSTYIKSSERAGYSMQSQPRVHQVNSRDGSSDVRRVIKPNYSPTYHTQVKPDDDDTAANVQRDGTPNNNTASYLSHPTNDESIVDVNVAGNFQPSHKIHGGVGSDRPMGRGRFLRYGSQMDHGAGRGRYHGPSSNDTFQASLKYRRPLSQRDRSFSPNERRRYPFAHQSYSRSPSRSRTRSPEPRISPRGRRSAAGNCGGPCFRHKSRSPNFRSEARMPRMRSPTHHQRFGADRMTGFRPFQGNHGSPPSSRWITGRKDELGHFTYKQWPMMDKSPNRLRVRDDRTDLLDSPRNPKPDVYYRQNNDKFSEMDETGRPIRLEGNFDNRRRQFGPIHNGRRPYEDGIGKRLHHDDDGFVSTNRNGSEFHGRGSRDIDNRNDDMPRRFRRDATFMYERDGKFSSNSKQFGFGGMDSSRNFKSGDPYRSINPGRFNQMDGAGRGHRYVDNHDERRRYYNAVCPPRRSDIEGIRRRISHNVDDNLPVPQSSCNDDATDSCGRNARGVDVCMDDQQQIGQTEEQQLDLSGQEMKLGETSNSTDVEVPAENGGG